MKVTTPDSDQCFSRRGISIILANSPVVFWLLTVIAMISSGMPAKAEITPYSWQRFDQPRNPGADATGNNHPITSGFTGNGENPSGTLPVVDNVAVGGPLGPEGLFSRTSLRAHANPLNNQGAMFVAPSSTGTLVNSNAWGNFFQTNDNWVVESWVLPTRNGSQQGVSTIIFATGLNRNNGSVGRQSGVSLDIINGQSQLLPAQNDGSVYLRAHANCPPNATDTNGLTMDFYIGPPILVKTSTNAEWIHAAIVRDTVRGTVGWYTNGVLVAETNIARVYTTNYFSSIGVAGLQDSGNSHNNGGIGLPGSASAYDGYMAELRWSAFLPGTFSTTNLLTRRAAPGSPNVWYGPVIVQSPKNISVWAGGAATFATVAASDTTLRYQWQRFSGSWANITDATNRLYTLENTALGDTAAQFRAILTKPANSLSATSAVATLTVQANVPSFVTGYSNAIIAEASLLAYFPFDGTGLILNNVKDPTRNGSISNAPFAFRTGNTNHVGGNQGLSLNLPDFEYTGGYGLKTNENGYAVIPGDHPGFDFATASGGNGTVEAVLTADPSLANILLTGGSSEVAVWLSSASIYNASGGTSKPAFDYFTFGVDGLGGLRYRNSSGADLTWTVPGGLFGKRRHVAFVFSRTTNVTAYVDGVSVGTKIQTAFGNTPPSASQPLTIGKGGGANADAHGYWRDSWRGTVDELAIYGSALSQAQLQQHIYRLNYGGNNLPASIAGITASKTLFTGFPVQILSVAAGGNPPFTYQWRSNSVNIANATNASYNFSGAGVVAGVYPFTVVLQGAVGAGITSAPVTLTTVNASGYAAKVYASSGGGPKAFYPLTETSGVNILDWAGTHDGVVSGGYRLSTGNDGPGGVGTGALTMYGTNAPTSNSKVEIPYYPELNPENGGNFTHEFWFKPNDTNVSSSPVSSQANAGNAKAGLATMVGPGNRGIAQTTVNNWTMIYGKYNNVNQGVSQNGAGGALPAVAGDWQHIASVADGNNATVTIYVNGQADFTQNVSYNQHPGDGSTTGGVNQNYYAPLLLGNYNGLQNFPMAGSLSQVAIYDYALNFDDVTNHTSQIWTQAIVTQQPAGVTAVESLGTFTLTAKALGVPNNYRWYKDGVPLVDFLNLDGTPHYPQVTNSGGASQGVFGPKLVVSQPKTNDSGAFSLRIFNPNNVGGFTNTTAAAVSITPETIAPTVTGVSARGVTVSGPVQDEATSSSGNPTPDPLSVVVVKFSERVNPSSATNPANYTISGGVTVTGVVLATSVADTKFSGDYRSVGLVTGGLTPGANYSVSIANVYDQATFSNKLVTTNMSFTAPILQAGRAVWNYYYRLGNGSFISLAQGTNGGFPYVPQFTAALTNLSSDTINPNRNLGDGASATFSGQGDNYVSTITAWITPTNTGYYEFFVNGDDGARLYLNPNGSDPSGAQWIGDAYSGDTQFNDIYSIGTHYRLFAGQPYFIQIVGLESNGNDSTRAGWRYLGSSDTSYDGSGANGAWIVDATNLPPIQTKFLSSYAPGGPGFSIQPANIVAAAGTTTNLAMTATTGTGLLSYQWQLNNANTGGNSDRLLFAPLAFGNFSTNYRVIVTDGVLSSTSAVVSVTPPLPTLLVSPSGKAVPQGLATSLTVSPATFSGQTNYQWQLGATNVSGAGFGGITAQTLAIASVQPTNVGPFRVIVNDGFNSLSLTSAVATVTVAVNPVITNSFSAGVLNFRVPTEVGPSYVLEYKNALTNGPWNLLSTNVGNGAAFTVPVGTTNAQGYFRLRMQ